MSEMRAPKGVDLRFSRLGTRGLLMEHGGALDLGIQQRFWALADLLGMRSDVQDVVLGMNNLLVVVDARSCRFDLLEAQICEVWPQLSPKALTGHVIEIPAIYGGARGEDMPELCRLTGLSVEEIARIHSGTDYVVFAAGAAPGFGYLYGLDPRLFFARKPVPAMRRHDDTINIGGFQTSLSPRRGITGWNAIGHSPRPPIPFDPERDPMSIVRVGDRVRFMLEGVE